MYFYPRSPCGERPPDAMPFTTSPLPFLSTLSLRRATAQKRYHGSAPADFYPRSPCGERLGASSGTNCKTAISIHALLAESDKPSENHANSQQEFLSTLSLRRATMMFFDYAHPGCISIHALLAESDLKTPPQGSKSRIFLSTLSLRRATQLHRHCHAAGGDFYPRSPCGERLLQHNADCNCRSISIHALLAESDTRIFQF